MGSGVKQHPWLVGIGLANEQDGYLLCSGSRVSRQEMYYNIIFDLLHHMSSNLQQRIASSQDPFSPWTPCWPPPPAYKIWPRHWYLFWYVFACVCMCLFLFVFVFVHVFWSKAMTILANYDHHKVIQWGPQCSLSMAMAILDIMTILAIMTIIRWPGGDRNVYCP